MFYIIASRLPMVYSDPKNTRYLKLFVIGSILYLFIHYYLFLESRAFLLELLKGKFYYIMAGDLLIACILTKFLSPRIKVEEDDEDESKNEIPTEDKQKIMRELEEKTRYLAELQMIQQQKVLQQQAHMKQQMEQMKKSDEALQAQQQTKKKVKSDSTDTTSESSTKSTSTSDKKKKKQKVKKVDNDKVDNDSDKVEKVEEKVESKVQSKVESKVSKVDIKSVPTQPTQTDTDTDMPVYE